MNSHEVVMATSHSHNRFGTLAVKEVEKEEHKPAERPTEEMRKTETSCK
jgi:hypothetical protein